MPKGIKILFKYCTIGLQPILQYWGDMLTYVSGRCVPKGIKILFKYCTIGLQPILQYWGDMLMYVSGRHVPDRRVSTSPKGITGRRMLLLSEGHVPKDHKGASFYPTVWCRCQTTPPNPDITGLCLPCVRLLSDRYQAIIRQVSRYHLVPTPFFSLYIY